MHVRVVGVLHEEMRGVLPVAGRLADERALVDQLANEGRLVIPLGTSEQWLTLIEKTTNGVTQRRTIPVRFVPLTRAQ